MMEAAAMSKENQLLPPFVCTPAHGQLTAPIKRKRAVREGPTYGALAKVRSRCVDLRSSNSVRNA